MIVVTTSCDVYMVPTAQDASERSRIHQAFEQKIRREAPPQLVLEAVVYSKAGVKYTTVTIYNVLGKQDQEWLLNALRTVRKHIATKPLRVSFYRQEVWSRDGTSATRGKEELLREETIP